MATMTPIDATDGLQFDDLWPLAFGEAADDPGRDRAVLSHTPGEWTGTMNPLIVAAMRDLLEEAPLRVTLDYRDRNNTDNRVSGELVALTAAGRAVLVGGTRGEAPTERIQVPTCDIYLLAF